MKMEYNKKYFTISLYFIFSIIVCTLFIALIYNFPYVWGKLQYLIAILMPFIFGFAFAYILNPIMRFIEQKIFPVVFKDKIRKSRRRVISLILTYLFAFVVIGIFLWVVLPQVAYSISGLIGKLAEYIGSIDTWHTSVMDTLMRWGISKEVLDTVSGYIETFLQQVYAWLYAMLPQLVSLTSKITTGVMNFVLGLIISIYMLSTKEKFFAQIKKCLYGLFPKSPVDRVVEVTRYSHKIFSGFIFGKLLDSLIIGILCFLGLSILRMPDALLVSVIVGVTNVCLLYTS